MWSVWDKIRWIYGAEERPHKRTRWIYRAENTHKENKLDKIDNPIWTTEH